MCQTHVKPRKGTVLTHFRVWRAKQVVFDREETILQWYNNAHLDCVG
jgi:hypothetical protein